MPTITQPELSRILGVPVRQIRRWTAAGYLNPTRLSQGRTPNTFDLDEVVTAIKEHNLKVSIDAGTKLAAYRRTHKE